MNEASDVPVVLLVEDNERSARLFSEILLANGYRLCLATDADECLERVRRQRPHVILMDQQLPGIDGVSVIHQLKEDPDTASIPIIALTAHAMPEHRDRLLAAGCCSYITKPISYHPFLQEIRRVLSEHGLRSTEVLNAGA